MADSNVRIIISAEDQATATMNKIDAAFKQYRSTYESIGQFTARQAQEANTLSSANTQLAASTNELSGSSQGLFTTFTAAGLAVNAITSAFQFIRSEITSSIEAANQYQSAIAGLTSYALAFGQSANAAKQSVQTLSADGLVPVTSNATALKDLLASGLNLQQAVTLMDAFKDRAAFGRDSSLSYGQAVENLAQSFKTEQSRLGDLSGMTENYSQFLDVGASQLGKNVSQLSEAERAQAKYLGILQLSTAATGDAGRYAETAAGQQAQLSYQVNQTQIGIGSALQPAVSLLAQTYVGMLQGMSGSSSALQNAQGAFLTLAAVVGEAANFIVGAGRLIIGTIQSIATGSFDPIKQAINDTVNQATDISVNWQKGLERIAAGTADNQVSQNQRALDTMSTATRNALDKMNQDIAKENQSFADSMQKRAQQFDDSLRDMIIAHRDKSRSIQQDIADENAAYADQVAQRKDQLTDQLSSLEDSHAQKVADITQNITDEKSKGLIVDGVLYAQANQKKLDDLRRQLDKENTAYQSSVDKAQEKYNKDIANDAKRHSDKLTNLKSSLAAELAILQKNAVDVAAIGDARAADDITRLRRSFAEQNAESQKQHSQRLADIAQQAYQQGVTGGNSYTAGTNQALNGGKGVLAGTMASIGADMGKSFAQSFQDTTNAQVARFDFTDWMNGVFKKMGEAFNKVKQWYQNTDWAKIVNSATSWQSSAVEGLASFFHIDPKAASRLLTGKATGGPVSAGTPYIVGERGQELFVPNQSGTIIPADRTQQMLSGAGGGTSITIGTVINNTQADLSSLARDIGFQIALRT